ncbi:MAG: DUF2125 domain-containing protein [Pikeienuella sp.]
MNFAGKSLIAVAGIAAIWSGGWFGVKAFVVEPEADRAIEVIRAGKQYLSYDNRSITGFPFGYLVHYDGVQLSDEGGIWRWSIDGITAERGTAETILMFQPGSVVSLDTKSFGAPDDTPPVLFELETDALIITAPDDPSSTPTIMSADHLSVTQKGAATFLSGLRLNMAGLKADYTLEDGSKGSFNYSVDGYETSYNLIQPDGGEQWAKSKSSAMVSKGYYNLSGFDAANPLDFLQGEGAINVTMKSEGFSGETGLSGDPNTPPFTMSYQIDDSDLLLQIESGSLRYAGETGAIGTTLTFDDPAPLPSGDINVAGMSVDIRFPYSPSEQPQSYLMAFSMGDLVVDEAFWSMGDPSGAIPRTPAGFAMEIGGEAIIHDYLNSLNAGSTATESPAEVQTVEIRQFDINAAGITVGLQGDLTVPNDAATPNGEIELKLSGISALLDNLVSGGIIPAPAADQYRAMWPSFLTAGDQPDTYTSKIVAKDGQVSVNGQRVQ